VTGRGLEKTEARNASILRRVLMISVSSVQDTRMYRINFTCQAYHLHAREYSDGALMFKAILAIVFSLPAMIESYLRTMSA
jgi:hypothetical protein